MFRDLDRYIEFYECLADSIFRFRTPGTRAICNIDSYVFLIYPGNADINTHDPS